jgi:outer membrane protein TolC
VSSRRVFVGEGCCSSWSIRTLRRAVPTRVVSLSFLGLGLIPLSLGLAAPAAAQTDPAPAERPAPEATEAVALQAQFAGEQFTPGGLTAVEAARRAAETSVQAASRREQVLIAANNRERILWDAAPRLTLTAQTTRFSPVDTPVFDGPDGPINFAQPLSSHLFNARLSVPLSDYLLRTVQALRGAGRSEDAARLDEQAERVTSAANAKISYYDWVRARLQRVLAEQALSQASAQLTRMRALQGVGRAAEADVLQAQAFEADAQLAFSQTQVQQVVAEERLRLSMHTPGGEPLSVGEDVLAEFPAANEALGVEELFREAVGQRLEIRSIQTNRAALEDLRSIEGSRALPRLDAIGNLTYANPNPRIFPQSATWNGTWDVGLALTWSVNDIGAAGTQSRIVRSQAAQLASNQVVVEEGLRLEVVSAHGALNQARVNVSTAEQGERAATAAFVARQRLQEQGLGTALELLQAETTRIQARLNLINAHIALRVARVQLDHAVGRDVVVLAQ